MMTLHYRPLFVLSLLLAVVVPTAFFVNALFPLAQASRVAALVSQAKNIDRQLEILGTENAEVRDQVNSIRKDVERLKEDLPETNVETSSLTPLVLITVCSTLAGIAGAISSIVLSWRKDLREVHEQLRALSSASDSNEPDAKGRLWIPDSARKGQTIEARTSPRRIGRVAVLLLIVAGAAVTILALIGSIFILYILFV